MVVLMINRVNIMIEAKVKRHLESDIETYNILNTVKCRDAFYAVCKVQTQILKRKQSNQNKRKNHS